MSLQGKVALVTGGAQGIGLAIVKSLLEEGVSVSFCDCNKEKGDGAMNELREMYGDRCMFVHCDVTNDVEFEGCFKETLAKFNCLDILVNNAGKVDESETGWRKMISLNLVSMIHGTHLGLKYMSKESGGRGGVVVNISALSGLHPEHALPIYSATKAAINQFSRSVGSDLHLAVSGVKVMAILPGGTRTSIEIKVVSARQKDVTAQYIANSLNSSQPQQASNVGRGLMEVLKRDENGSLWLIEKDQPPVLVNLSG